jgi:hypothetical protein
MHVHCAYSVTCSAYLTRYYNWSQAAACACLLAFTQFTFITTAVVAQTHPVSIWRSNAACIEIRYYTMYVHAST